MQSRQTGVNYTKEWIVEWLLMRIKSPVLYKHLRNNKILALPTIRTMNNYIRGDETDCGISKGVLNGLKIKLDGMRLTEKERHGVLILDEMSLKEHVDYDSNT